MDLFLNPHNQRSRKEGKRMSPKLFFSLVLYVRDGSAQKTSQLFKVLSSVDNIDFSEMILIHVKHILECNFLLIANGKIRIPDDPKLGNRNRVFPNS